MGARGKGQRLFPSLLAVEAHRTRETVATVPLIERRFDPLGNRNGTNVSALADQIHDRPVPLAHLDLTHLQAN